MNIRGLITSCCIAIDWDLRLIRSLLLWRLLRTLHVMVGEPFDVCVLLYKM